MTRLAVCHLVDRGEYYEVAGTYGWGGGRRPNVKALRAAYAAELRRYAGMLEGSDGWERGGESVGRTTRSDALVLGKEDA